MQEPSETEITAALCRKSLKHFVQEGWHVLEPETELVWNWHLDVICDHIQAILEGPKRKGPWTQNLIINVPPGTMKSLITSVFAPAWQWLRKPSWRAIYVSANPKVSLRDSMKCKDVITSDWYQSTFQPKWKLSDDQNSKSLYKNTKGGFRSAFSVGASVTGDRADAIFIDDPLDAGDRNSEPIRTAANDWYSSALRNRLANSLTGTRVLIMQRLHEEDLAGYIIEREKGVWDRLIIPMEGEAEPHPPTFLGWQDKREPGELLMPARWPKHILDEEKTSLGENDYAGQHQQRPSAIGGNKFKREWWRFWKDPRWPSWKVVPTRPKDAAGTPSIALPERFDAVWQSWDCTFGKVGKRNDYVVGMTVGMKGANRFVLEVVRRKMLFAEMTLEVKAMRSRWPRVNAILIEDKANGPAVIETLKELVAGIIAVNPEGGKESRAAGMEPKVRAGNWVLPSDPQCKCIECKVKPDPEHSGARFLDIWLNEFGGFPNGRHDDCVDAASQIETYLTDSDYARLLRLCAK